MSLIEIRKKAVTVETVFHEGGPPPEKPLRMAAAVAVVRNPYAGRYERSSDRLSYFDTVNESRGHSAFTLAGPDLPEAIEGRCRMRESSLDLGLVEVTTRPMAYRCEFSAECAYLGDD